MSVIVKGDFEGPVFGTIHGAHLSSVIVYDNDGGGGGEK